MPPKDFHRINIIYSQPQTFKYLNSSEKSQFDLFLLSNILTTLLAHLDFMIDNITLGYIFRILKCSLYWPAFLAES